VSLGAVAIVSFYTTHTLEPKHADVPPPVQAPPPDDGVDAAILAIQKKPRFPELGATRAEARAICERERGSWIDRGEKVGCQIEHANVFACELDEQSSARACTHWKLGADLTDERDTIAETNGPPTSVARGERGFREYTWKAPTKTITLSGYPAGVSVTESLAAEEDHAP
jgi:hypothetical protein